MNWKNILQKLTARYRKNLFVSGFLSLMGKEISKKKWIFIVGCYNSGTTLLDQILSDHPSISGLPDEGVMLTSKLPRPEDFGWRRMWWKCREKMTISKEDGKRNSEIIKKQWSHFLNLEREYLLEKSISNTCRMEFFEEHFAPAYFIHIVRNGYAVAEGIQRKAVVMENNPFFDKKKYPIEICAEQWVKSIKVVEEQRPRVTNFLEISYEELTRTPEKIIKEILDFLGLEHFNESYFENSFQIHEKESQIINMNASSFKKLAPEDKRIITEVASEYLRKYGYL